MSSPAAFRTSARAVTLRRRAVPASTLVNAKSRHFPARRRAFTNRPNAASSTSTAALATAAVW
jgi:hypothetical protein